MTLRKIAICALCVFVLGPALAQAQQVTLVDFSKNFDLAAVELRGVKLSLHGGVLRMEAEKPDAAAEFTLKAPDGRWNLSTFHEVAVDVRNIGPKPVTVACRAEDPDCDGTRHSATASIALAPGERNIVRVKLTQALPPELRLNLYGVRAKPLGICADIDSSHVTRLVISVAEPGKNCSIEIGSPQAWTLSEPNEPIGADQLFPMIDKFGQFIHKDWPGKTHSMQDLALRKQEEAADLAAHPGPADWDQYGGWKTGPQLKATGFFRTEKHNGKWWLVDPEGHLFWSMGINVINMEGGSTPVTDREHWFADLPKPEHPFAKFYRHWDGVSHGYYKKKPFDEFNFTSANLMRKYGADWENQFAELVHPRLRSWGVNTIACMSDSKPIMMRKTPYTGMIGVDCRRLEGVAGGFWSKFYDVFDPAFVVSAERQSAENAKYVKKVGEQWCVGVFVENELGWGNETSFAVGALRSPADQPAKHAFIGDLRRKYETIEKLNAAWGSQYASWDAMLQSTGSPPDREKARVDLEAFYTRFAERFFDVCLTAFKKEMPNILCFGCRFSRSNPLAVRAAAKYCDVVSFNRYQYSVADLRLPQGTDKPIIIGEFQFGAIDRGVFNPSLSPTADQQDRANAYKRYVESALDNPAIVGVHWFQFGDQAATGRGDEENYQIGFVDICDTPYAEIIRCGREIGSEMYERRNAP